MPYFEEKRPTLERRLVRLKECVEVARERREREQPLWKDTYNYYRSDPPTQWDPAGMKLQVNFPFAYYESLRPSLVFENPTFSAEPLSQESEESQKTVETAVNAELRAIKFRNKLERVAFDGIHYGVGIFQLGFYDQGLIPSTAAGSDEEPAANVSVETNANRSSDLPFGIRPGQIYVLHIRPWNFMIDPDATCLDDAMWCCVEYVRSLEAVKGDRQYSNTSNLEANEYNCPDGMSPADYQTKFGRQPEKNLVRLCQFWDLVDRKIYTFSKGHDKFLATHDMTLPVQRFPFYVFHATDDNETFWNQSPMVPWLNLVEEYNLAISNRLDHLSRFKRKYAYDSSRVTEEDIEALRHPMDGTLVPVSGGGQPVRGAVEPIPDANVSTDSYAFTSEMMQRWTQISGMSEFDLGGSRPGERPAAEIERISGAANGRRAAIAGRLRSTLEDFADDVRAVMEKYYSKERAVRLTGDRGETIWTKYDGSGLSGEYLWKCKIEEMRSRTREQRTQEAAQKLQLLTPYSQVGGSPQPLIDIRPQLKELAQEIGVNDLRFFPESGPPMDPGHEFFLMTKKGLDLEPHQMDDHEWHIAVHDSQRLNPEALKSPSALERLENHIEAHRAHMMAMQQNIEGQQKVQQQRQGGSPGPEPGQTNNPSGGGGVFATGQGNSTPNSGGATGQNIQELLRGGF